ncbi:metal-dependent hydrolase [Rubritalea tangerina]|uniref:Metal-dependent hydrolase n=1 Tax=Rubritalea tangerina TaxID=430798 RepID=A0ABW4Z8J9_9BACT
MNTVTHALLPVVAICLYQRFRKSDFSLNKFQYALITFAGAAPDLFTPHFSIASRYSSWSHTLPALITFTVILLTTASFKFKTLTTKVAVFMVVAYSLHLACDALSGGIPWLLPYSDAILGDYYISPSLWIPFDVILVFTTYILARTVKDSSSATTSV